MPQERTTPEPGPGAPAEAGNGAGSGDHASADPAAGVPVDWERLAEAAREAMTHAYAPYSRYPVGAAALTDDGRLISGCNVENAAYGVVLCAECTLVGELHMTGGGTLRAFYCVDGSGQVLMPCGRCRQLLYEHRGPGLELMTVRGIRTMDEVLPDAFGPDNLKGTTA
ncbi:cytidine deaminase [Zafaria sp. Z1313]|uniref:cytidine deaminase n=1 Tax=unclassified Zafaria TaxID=2828765 RepID=UPI002E780E95|nr:cytidine deaminase [Zafaria sp. J156]MEE1619901.1 cytidine deaminase [Zafaria sp. J156]